jgi:Tol biopolymer transport system component
MLAAAATVAAGTLLVLQLRTARAPFGSDARAMQFEITPPAGTTFGRVISTLRPLAVSPDGRQLAMIAGPRDRRQMLWIRPLDSDTPRPVPGTEGAAHPFWSLDGKWVGFVLGGTVRRVDPTGGQPQIVGDTDRPGGAFDAAGVAIVTRNGQPLLRLSTPGGRPEPLFPLDASRGEIGQYDPILLPDGKHVVFISSAPDMGLVFASVDGSVRRFLFQQRNSPADFAADPAGGPGYLLYSFSGQLMARRFDPARGEVIGDAVRIADNVISGPTTSVSTNGVLTFRHNTQPRRQLAWFTRDGKEQSLVGDPGAATGMPRIAPGGASIAVSRVVDGNADIWIDAPDGGATTRFTFEPGTDNNPVWSPDGQRLYFASIRDSGFKVIERPASGLGAERIVLDTRTMANVALPESMSSDGRWLLIRSGGAGQADVSFVSTSDSRTVPFPESGRVNNASLSPDGRWIAYEMSSGATPDIFVRGVPREVNGSAVDAKRQLSTSGGFEPLWRGDGKEILYIAPDGILMSVPVEAGDGTLRTAPPRSLFKVGDNTNFDVTADGQRILVNRPESEVDPPVSVIVNWPALLRN